MLLAPVQTPARTITLEHYAAIVLMREAPGMVGFLDTPRLIGASPILSGLCCTEDETPYRYRINTQTAHLVNIYEV
jgi:hypothetical protein